MPGATIFIHVREINIVLNVMKNCSSWIHRRGYQSELYVKGTSINPFKILNKHLIDLKIKNQLESKLIIEVDVVFF
jgi:hypothetical protein